MAMAKQIQWVIRETISSPLTEATSSAIPRTYVSTNPLFLFIANGPPSLFQSSPDPKAGCNLKTGSYGVALRERRGLHPLSDVPHENARRSYRAEHSSIACKSE